MKLIGKRGMVFPGYPLWKPTLRERIILFFCRTRRLTSIEGTTRTTLYYKEHKGGIYIVGDKRSFSISPISQKILLVQLEG